MSLADCSFPQQCTHHFRLSQTSAVAHPADNPTYQSQLSPDQMSRQTADLVLTPHLQSAASPMSPPHQSWNPSLLLQPSNLLAALPPQSPHLQQAQLPHSTQYPYHDKLHRYIPLMPMQMASSSLHSALRWTQPQTGMSLADCSFPQQCTHHFLLSQFLLDTPQP